VRRIERFRLTLAVHWWSFQDWCLRWIHAQHNARVIVDFENRMSSVIADATGSMMSKSYYTTEAMIAEMAAFRQRECDEAYAEGRKDLAEEIGIADPSPFTPEHLT
jgi:hypothetical protein